MFLKYRNYKNQLDYLVIKPIEMKQNSILRKVCYNNNRSVKTAFKLVKLFRSLTCTNAHTNKQIKILIIMLQPVLHCSVIINKTAPSAANNVLCGKVLYLHPKSILHSKIYDFKTFSLVIQFSIRLMLKTE